MKQSPTILMASTKAASDLLEQARLLVDDFTIVTEANFHFLVQRSLIENPDLILVELNPLTETGLQLIADLRQEQAMPLLVALDKVDASRMLQVYNMGADDCILEPLDEAVFLAKINAWMNPHLALPVEMPGMELQRSLARERFKNP